MLRHRHSVRPTVAELVADLGEIPAETRKGLRAGFEAAAQSTLRQAQANASWSSRIPAAITVRTKTTKSNPGASLRVSASEAPHARPFEGITDNRATFRHPLFGDRDQWYAEPIRPFLFPAVRDTKQDYVDAAKNAVDAAARRSHFT